MLTIKLSIRLRSGEGEAYLMQPSLLFLKAHWRRKRHKSASCFYDLNPNDFVLIINIDRKGFENSIT